MNFKQFLESDFQKLFESNNTTVIAADLRDNIIWASPGFYSTTGLIHKNIKGRPFQWLIMGPALLKLRDGSRHCILRGNPDLARNVYEGLTREGIHVNISEPVKYKDFKVYAIRFFHLNLVNTFYRHIDEMYGAVKNDMTIIEYNRPLYSRLRSLAKRIRGSRLTDYLKKEDYQAWKKSIRKFEEYCDFVIENSPGDWKAVFDSRKETIRPLSIIPSDKWTAGNNSLEHKSSGKPDYFLINRKFDLINNDIRVEVAIEKGAGVIVLGTSDKYYEFPDSTGYGVGLVTYPHRDAEFQIKRNLNIVGFSRQIPETRSLVFEKVGNCIQVFLGSKGRLLFKDNIPFEPHNNRIGFCSEKDVRFTDIKIFTRKTIFDYDKMWEFRSLVRFRDDPERYYEMHLFDGEVWQRPNKIVCIRELSDLLKAEKRIAEYQKELQSAQDRLVLEHKGFHGIIGKSLATEEIINTVRTVAPTKASVLITGDTGVGKEMVARALYGEAGQQGPFIKVDCSVLAPNLIESELFGHEKGAFTGAVSQKKGKFEAADGGTLFLDEVGNIPPSIQVKLLRFLNDMEFERVGGTKTMRSDVRVITATNADLSSMINKGDFRSDLYFRLKVITINIPPLRERREDIYPLVELFMRETCSKENISVPHIDNDVLPFLLHYEWPGNVRELKNIIDQTIVLHRVPSIKKEHFPKYIAQGSGALFNLRPSVGPEGRTVPGQIKSDQYKNREYFQKVYDDCYGDILKVAQHFGIATSTARFYTREHKISRKKNYNLEKVSGAFKDREFTIQDVMNLLGVSFPTAKKLLVGISGKLEKRKMDRYVYYRLTS
jgi:two-component system NtrC family response regulator